MGAPQAIPHPPVKPPPAPSPTCVLLTGAKIYYTIHGRFAPHPHLELDTSRIALYTPPQIQHSRPTEVGFYLLSVAQGVFCAIQQGGAC